MELVDSQRDMNSAYVSGSTGVLASGLVWLTAGFIGISLSNVAAMLTLFFGGTLIFTLSILLSKLLSASGKHSAENCLRYLALESLATLFGGILIAFYVAQSNQELFFPIMLLAIGARYFSFQTLYGLREYWLLGALLMISGVACALLSLPFVYGAFMGAILEILFAIILLRKHKSVVSQN